MRIAIVLFLSLFLYQCGLLNPYAFGNNAIPPYKIESHSVNNNIYLTVYSYNQKEIRELINGYNIYFSYNNSISDIENNIIYIDAPKSIPSIKYYPKTDYYSFDIKLEGNFSYGTIVDSSNTNVTLNKSILPFTSYYFIIVPITDLKDLSKNKFYFISKETTEYNDNNKTISLPGTYIYQSASFNFSAGVNAINNRTFLSSTNGTKIQDIGAVANPNSVREALLDGYSSDPIMLWKGHVYMYKTSNGNYGKIYIKDISATSVIVDISYQGKNNELEI